MTTKSSGFSLVELLVVVAILGILSAVATISYNGYVAGTKKTATKSYMQQVSLAQTEEISNTGNFFDNGDENACNGSATTSRDIETNLFGKLTYEFADQNNPTSKTAKEIGYEICIASDSTNPTNYFIMALEVGETADTGCVLTLSRVGDFLENDNC